MTTSSLVQIILLASLGLALFVLVWVTIAARHLAMPFEFDEVHTLTAADGGKFILARLRPKVGPSPLPPVLMCHGLAMNRRAFALDPQASLARRLSDAGRDVWVLELRGAAADTRGPGLRLATFDTYLTQDDRGHRGGAGAHGRREGRLGGLLDGRDARPAPTSARRGDGCGGW
ncbi:MAG: hypothetical protein R3A52_20455 [Polyangiales bacterium]